MNYFSCQCLVGGKHLWGDATPVASLPTALKISTEPPRIYNDEYFVVGINSLVCDSGIDGRSRGVGCGFAMSLGSSTDVAATGINILTVSAASLAYLYSRTHKISRPNLEVIPKKLQNSKNHISRSFQRRNSETSFSIKTLIKSKSIYKTPRRFNIFGDILRVPVEPVERLAPNTH